MINLKRDLSGDGYLLIKNIPIGNVANMKPNDDSHFINKISEGSLLAMAQLVGEPIAYKNEKEGQLVHNLYPQEESIEQISNAGSLRALPLHCEDVHLGGDSPDHLAVLCLREEPKVKVVTKIVNGKDIIKNLSCQLIDKLKKKQFYVTPPESFQTDSDTEEMFVAKLMPVIEGSNLIVPQFNVEFTDMKGVNGDAQKALDEFKSICLESFVVKNIVLEAKDMLLINNRKSFHGRVAFESKFASNNCRWLQRTLIKNDLWSVRDHFCSPRTLNF